MKTTSEEISLFNHDDFGEGFLAMAYHVRDMSQLDRMIFEDCLVVDGAVVAPHLNVKSRCPVHLRPEILQKKIRCTFHQAVMLADAWSIIEATPKMVETFILWIQAKGIDNGLSYFEHLAMKLAEVEVSWDSDAAEPLLGDDAIVDGDDDHAGADDSFDLPVDPDETYREEIPDLYGYHIIGYDDVAFLGEKNWEQKQPEWYLSLLFKLRDVNDLKSLKIIGKYAYQFDLSRGQAGVIWYEYQKAKNRIMGEIRQQLSPSARRMLMQIRNANGRLSAVGALMYKIQHGAVKIADPLSDSEWSILWDAYHEQKEALGLEGSAQSSSAGS
jgi:hypothetical protein